VTNPALAGAVALVLALALTPLCMAVARRLDIVDRPGPLKPQQSPVPYLGGVAVFAALTPSLAYDHAGLLLPLAGALVLGVVDDVRGLSPVARLAGQAAVGLGIAAVLPVRVGAPLGTLGVLAVTLLLVNGVNMIDGLDALSGGVLAASCAAWAVLLGGPPRALAAAGVGAALGFLVFNRPPARVYLGDGGAYVLGALGAVLVASAWAPGQRTSTGVAVLLPAAVPTAEVAFAIVRRARGRGSVVAGDRRHPYDLLVARGWQGGSAAAAYIVLATALGVIAVAAGAMHSTSGAVALAASGGAALLVAAARCGALRPERGLSR